MNTRWLYDDTDPRKVSDKIVYHLERFLSAAWKETSGAPIRIIVQVLFKKKRIKLIKNGNFLKCQQINEITW